MPGGAKGEMLRLETFCVRLLEITFFSGLAGCALVVVCSWVSIFKSGFSDRD